jgi:hypothetical protein
VPTWQSVGLSSGGKMMLVFLNVDVKLWVPSNDARNDQMVILTITRVRKRTEVPL